MHGRFLFLAPFYVAVLAASGHAAGPDDPMAPVPAGRYSSIMSGTKSYRPVEPLPWSDVIRRVMPKAKQSEERQAPQDKSGVPSEPKQ
jgi:hypothetical protein